MCVQLATPLRDAPCQIKLGAAVSPPLTHQLFWLAPVITTGGGATPQPRLVHGRRVYRVMVVHSGFCLEEKPRDETVLFAGLCGHPIQAKPRWADDNDAGLGAIQCVCFLSDMYLFKLISRPPCDAL